MGKDDHVEQPRTHASSLAEAALKMPADMWTALGEARNDNFNLVLLCLDIFLAHCSVVKPTMRSS